MVNTKMAPLLRQIAAAKGTPVKQLIMARMGEFHFRRSPEELFSELCFCLLTANTSAELGMKCQTGLCKGEFEELPEKELADALKRLGYRFYNRRAHFIAEARTSKPWLANASRDWLVENIKGLGLKEASHFLRNTGHDDYAIIDFHIVDLLVRYKLIKKPKTLTPKKYLEIEALLWEIAKAGGLTLAELDLYLWYIETGKVLK